MSPELGFDLKTPPHRLLQVPGRQRVQDLLVQLQDLLVQLQDQLEQPQVLGYNRIILYIRVSFGSPVRGSSISGYGPQGQDAETESDPKRRRTTTQ